MAKCFLYFTLFLLSVEARAQTAIGSWNNLGPIQFPLNYSVQVNGIGRVCQVKFHPTDSLKMYAVSASGGLYITDDGGVTWAHTPGTDNLPATECSSICIDYTNDSILYLGTGDPNYYFENYGIWKSTDGGITWNPSNTGIGNLMAVEILMDPTNHNHLVAATNAGIWKTTNAGLTWTQTHPGGNFTDMKMKPGSSSVLYAVTRTQFFRSIDFGTTWSEYSGTDMVIPATFDGDGLRIAVSAANNSLVYVGTSTENGAIYKSNDGGLSFSNVYRSDTQCLVCYYADPTSGSQHNYNFSLTANPENANELILVSHCVWRSTDGGVTWSKRTSWGTEMHTDMHDIKFDPYNNTRKICANDGGVWATTDTVSTYWVPISNGIAAMELYHLGQSPSDRQLVDVGAQDNGENDFDGVWKCNGGGDMGSVIAFDYQNIAMVYHVNEGSRKQLIPISGDQSLHQPFTITGSPVIEFVPTLTGVAFYGEDTLYRTDNLTDPSPSWSRVGIMSGNIRAMASCRADSNILYVVTDDGHLYRSDNALAASPVFHTFTTPDYTYIETSIATDQSDVNKVYISCGTGIYESNNKGVSWTNITGHLPALNINKIIHDDKSTNGRLFVCIGNYVYYKSNTDTGWIITHGLPTVADFTDMGIYNDGTAASILRLSTYGRGTWEVGIDNDMPPAINFSANKHDICSSDTVIFSKTIYGSVSSLKWRFPGGFPDSSALDSPQVVYYSSGIFPVTLIATGPGGTDSVVKTFYITVDSSYDTPFQQGFEDGFPPALWNNILTSGSYQWQQTNDAGGYGLSDKSVWFDNYYINTNGTSVNLISPEINLAHSVNAYITFDVAYARYPGYNDSLNVGVSNDCGNSYTTVYSKDSTLLATAPDKIDTIFIPSATQWRTDTISLNSYLGEEVRLAFENIGHFGQALYLDNVNLHITHTATLINTVDKNVHVEVYPNPTNGIVHIDGKGVTGQQVHIACYTMAGIAIIKKDAQIFNGSFDVQLNLAGQAAQPFELQIITDVGHLMTKTIILK